MNPRTKASARPHGFGSQAAAFGGLGSVYESVPEVYRRLSVPPAATGLGLNASPDFAASTGGIGVRLLPKPTQGQGQRQRQRQGVGLGSPGASPGLPPLAQQAQWQPLGQSQSQQSQQSQQPRLAACVSAPILSSPDRSSSRQRHKSFADLSGRVASRVSTAESGAPGAGMTKGHGQGLGLGQGPGQGQPQLTRNISSPPTARTPPMSEGGRPGTGQKRVIKNISVWQRYQAQPKSGLQMNEVLERDRERQRSTILSSSFRQVVSPTKSRTASIFFGNLPGNSDDSIYNCLPPGALRHMARPHVRKAVLPDKPTGSAVSSTQGCVALGRGDNRRQLDKDKDIGKASEKAVFEGNEDLLVELSNVLESFAALVAPPENQDHSEKAHGLAPRAHELPDSHVLRPMFCRFLLASGLCGNAQSEYSYHECVAAFDEHAIQPVSGSPSSLPRSTLLKIISHVIWPDRGYEDADDRSETQQMEMISDMKKKIQVVFRPALQQAADHGKARRRRLEDLRAGKIKPAEAPEQVKPSDDISTTDSETSKTTWPPLPPHYITEKELPAYMEGVKQWEEELHSQNADRLRALRGHTDAVLLGEILVGQLLEPEVLQFASRFRPLFKRLFQDYADWPVLARGPVVPIAEGKRGRCEHMSFAAFFKFCVDFGLFPKHASFEEIHRVYMDAEALEPVSPRRRVGLPEKAALIVRTLSAMSTSADGQRGSPTDARRSHRLAPPGQATPKPNSPSARRSIQGSHSLLPTGRSSSKGRSSTSSRESPKHHPGHGTGVDTASAQAEANLPKVDLKLFDRPLILMTDFEVSAVAFLAGIGDWLSERFIRLADYVGDFFHALPSEDEHEELDAVPVQRTSSVRSVRSRSGTEDDASALLSPPTSPAHSRSTTVSAKQFYELTLPMGAARPVTEDEVVELYRLLLNDMEDDGDEPPPDIPVFQLDKAVHRAKQRMEQERQQCCRLFRKDKEQSHRERVCCRFLEAFDAQLRSFLRGTDGDLEDIFQGRGSISPQELLDQAVRLGVEEELLPSVPALGNVFVQVGARNGSSISRPLFWRLMAVIAERLRAQRQTDVLHRMRCLAHTKHSGPTERVFGLGAFTECLLKLGLHRLGSKGGCEIQRASPSWWKCVWLLMVLGGCFSEHVQIQQHYDKVRNLAMSLAPTSSLAAGSGSRSSTPASRASTPGFIQRPSTGSISFKLSRTAGSTLDLLSRGETVPEDHRKGHKDKDDKEGYEEARPGSATDSPSFAKTAPSTPARTRLSMRHSTVDPANLSRDLRESYLGQSLDLWWRCVHTKPLATFVPPLERLVAEAPSLFEHENAESSLSSELANASEWEYAGLCHTCLEPRSPSGWGSPGCPTCSGVEEFCLPLEKHLFKELLWTPPAPPAAPPPAEQPDSPSSQSVASPVSPSRRLNRMVSRTSTFGM